MKILIPDFMDQTAIDQLRVRFNVHYEPSLFENRKALLDIAVDATALIVRNRVQVDAELLARAPQLRVVGRLGVGLDNVDLGACKARGIEVIPATGTNALAVAEYVICTVMLLLRGAYQSSTDVAAGKWPRNGLINGRETAGKTLGIVGLGSIGRLTAKLANNLGMRVLGVGRTVAADVPQWKEVGVEYRPLDDLLSESDAVTLHVPLAKETQHLINASRISKMKKGAVLINAARGGVIDEAALVAALRSGHLAGAAFDVFENEPLPAGSPLVDVPNLILTPHIAGVTRESNARASAMIAAKVTAALDGTQQHAPPDAANGAARVS